MLSVIYMHKEQKLKKRYKVNMTIIHKTAFKQPMVFKSEILIMDGLLTKNCFCFRYKISGVL